MFWSFLNNLILDLLEKANGPKVVKILDLYIQIHAVRRNIRLDQALCSIGNKV